MVADTVRGLQFRVLKPGDEEQVLAEAEAEVRSRLVGSRRRVPVWVVTAAALGLVGLIAWRRRRSVAN